MSNLRILGQQKVGAVKKAVKCALGLDIKIYDQTGAKASDGVTIGSIRTKKPEQVEVRVVGQTLVKNVIRFFEDNYGIKIDVLTGDGSVADPESTLGSVKRTYREKNRESYAKEDEVEVVGVFENEIFEGKGSMNMRFTVSTTENSHLSESAIFENESNGWELTIETKYAFGEYVIDPGGREIEEDDDFYVSAFEGYELLSASKMERRDFFFLPPEPSEDEKKKIQAGYEAEGISYLEENGWTLEDHIVLISGGVEIDKYLWDDD